ncbi:N-acetyltransferase family protein [Halostagnicola bangensis]
MESGIRVATPADAGEVRRIYAPFCEDSAVTFEESVPDESEMVDRIEETLETYPWLVCERDGDVVGYAYASKLRKRRAYEWVVELSVYVAEDARRSGVGRALYESLFAVLERQGVCDVYAVTTVPNPETVRFHERLGFDRFADFPRVGYTQGEWHDVRWWRRELADKPENPNRPDPFPEVFESADLDELVTAGESRLELF